MSKKLILYFKSYFILHIQFSDVFSCHLNQKVLSSIQNKSSHSFYAQKDTTHHLKKRTWCVNKITAVIYNILFTVSMSRYNTTAFIMKQRPLFPYVNIDRSNGVVNALTPGLSPALTTLMEWSMWMSSVNTDIRIGWRPFR